MSIFIVPGQRGWHPGRVTDRRDTFGYRNPKYDDSAGVPTTVTDRRDTFGYRNSSDQAVRWERPSQTGEIPSGIETPTKWHTTTIAVTDRRDTFGYRN